MDSEYDYSGTSISYGSVAPMHARKKIKFGGGGDSAGGDSSSSGESSQSSGGSEAVPNSYRKGGMVRKGGMAKVHAGERVLTAAQNRRYQRRKRACK